MAKRIGFVVSREVSYISFQIRNIFIGNIFLRMRINNHGTIKSKYILKRSRIIRVFQIPEVNIKLNLEISDELYRNILSRAIEIKEIKKSKLFYILKNEIS